MAGRISTAGLRHRIITVGLAALIGATLAAGPTGSAPTRETSPATQPMSAETAARIAQVRAAANGFESQPLDVNASAVDGASPNAADAAAAEMAKRNPTLDFTRVAAALAIVVALIVASRWMFRRFFAGASAPATSRAVKVIGRTPLAPRQQVLLLQVGTRVVVVGESNGTLSTLAQISEADEVARLLGQLQDEQIQRGVAFGGLFSRVQRRYEEGDANDPHPATESLGEDGTHQTARTQAAALEDEQHLAHAKSELSGLVEKVRSLRSQLGQGQ